MSEDKDTKCTCYNFATCGVHGRARCGACTSSTISDTQTTDHIARGGLSLFRDDETHRRAFFSANFFSFSVGLYPRRGACGMDSSEVSRPANGGRGDGIPSRSLLSLPTLQRGQREDKGRQDKTRQDNQGNEKR